MKNQTCPCAKKKKRKTTKLGKKVSVPAASYNKFAGIRAPILANTGGTFTMPGFAPVQAFPYPGLKVGNTSQMYGLLTGSNLADLAAANIYRVQDKKDDVASGIGITGLNSAPKGNVTARRINMNMFGSLIPPVKVEGQPSISEVLKRQQLAQQAARFYAYNPGLGDSADNPIPISGTNLAPSSSSTNQQTTSKKQPLRQAAAVGIQKRTGVTFTG